MTLLAAGLIGIVLSILFTMSSVDNLFTEVADTTDSFEESGVVI